MDDELNKILSSNPFTRVEKDWRTFCRNYTKSGSEPLPDFVLPDDQNRVQEFNRQKSLSKNGEEYSFKPHLLPQPYLGHPDAPIWILMINPGYSRRDEYDLLGVNKVYKDLAAQDIGVDCHFPDDEHIVEELHWRQDAVINQLVFNLNSDAGKSIYLMDKRFDSIKAKKSKGGYAYWSNHLFGRGSGYFMSWLDGDIAKIAFEKIFILEMMPYHSAKFDGNFLVHPKYGWANSPYFRFWRDLMYYGLEHDKLFLVRSPKKIVRQLISGDEAWDIGKVCNKILGRFFALFDSQGGRYNSDGLGLYLPLGDLMSRRINQEEAFENVRKSFRSLQMIIPSEKWETNWRCDFTDE